MFSKPSFFATENIEVHNIEPGPLVKWGNTGRLRCNTVDQIVLFADIAESLSFDVDEFTRQATDVDVDGAIVLFVDVVGGFSFDVDEFAGGPTDVDIDGRLAVEEVGVDSFRG